MRPPIPIPVMVLKKIVSLENVFHFDASREATGMSVEEAEKMMKRLVKRGYLTRKTWGFYDVTAFAQEEAMKHE